MIDRVKERFDLRPRRLAGDTVYGAVRLLKWLVDRDISPHIPVWDKSARSDGTFSRADFFFDRSRNVYICPKGKLLHTTGTVIDGGTLRYQVPQSATRCVRAQNAVLSQHAWEVDSPRSSRGRPRCRPRPGQNRGFLNNHAGNGKKVEMQFSAHMKHILKLDRLRLRGLSGAKDEVLLTATAQNLRRLVRFICRPPPSAPAPCAG